MGKSSKSGDPVLTVTRRVFTREDGVVGVSSERPSEVGKLAAKVFKGSSVGIGQADTLAVLQWELEQAGGGLRSIAGVIAGAMGAVKGGTVNEPDHLVRLKAGEMAGRVFRVLGTESRGVPVGEGGESGEVTGYVEITATTSDAELLAGVLGDNVKRRFGGENGVSLEEAQEAVSLIGGFADEEFDTSGGGIVDDLDVSEPVKGLDGLGDDVVVLHKAGVKSKGLSGRKS